MQTIEWPIGSGVVAVYAPHERALLSDVIASAEKPGTDRSAVAREVEFLHTLKATIAGAFLP